jgi:hypothetical protein
LPQTRKEILPALPAAAVKQNCQKKAQQQIQLQQLLLHNRCSRQHIVPVSFRGGCATRAAAHQQAANAHMPMHDTRQLKTRHMASETAGTCDRLPSNNSSNSMPYKAAHQQSLASNAVAAVALVPAPTQNTTAETARCTPKREHRTTAEHNNKAPITGQTEQQTTTGETPKLHVTLPPLEL